MHSFAKTACSKPKLPRCSVGTRVGSIGDLALIERLCDEARDSLRWGLLTPTQGRHLTRLPRGNQLAAMTAATAAALTSRELSDVVDLLQSSSTEEQTNFVLSKPREAIRQSQESYIHTWDPRMSARATGLPNVSASSWTRWPR